MGYDLTNDGGGHHQWKALGWWQLLNLAHRYGWRPRGTRLSSTSAEEPRWDGNYFANAGQEVTEEDARGLATALQQMLNDPGRETMVQEVVAQMQRVVDDGSELGMVSPLDVLHYPAEFAREMMSHFGQRNLFPWTFDEKSNAYLREFIEFCRSGSFRIE